VRALELHFLVSKWREWTTCSLWLPTSHRTWRWLSITTISAGCRASPCTPCATATRVNTTAATRELPLCLRQLPPRPLQSRAHWSGPFAPSTVAPTADPSILHEYSGWRSDGAAAFDLLPVAVAYVVKILQWHTIRNQGIIEIQPVAISLNFLSGPSDLGLDRVLIR